MLKRIIAFITAVFLIFSLTACGNKKDDKKGKDKTNNATISESNKEDKKDKDETDTDSTPDNDTVINKPQEEENSSLPDNVDTSQKGGTSAPTIGSPSFIGSPLTDIISNKEYTDKYIFVEKWEENEEYPYGYVFDQVVNEGETKKDPTKITLFVSMGYVTKKIPDFAGQTEAKAVSRLEAIGFKVKIVKDYSDSCAEGCVIKTDPQATTILKKGETVTVYVSLGPKPDDSNQDTMEGFKPWS